MVFSTKALPSDGPCAPSRWIEKKDIVLKVHYLVLTNRQLKVYEIAETIGFSRDIVNHMQRDM